MSQCGVDVVEFAIFVLLRYVRLTRSVVDVHNEESRV